MDARHDVPLETVEGVRTSASGGERILIGLALIALLGGAFIGFGNLLGVNLEATATDTPRPTLEGSPTPRPTASPRPPREFALDSVPDPIPEPSEESEFYWIRALEDIPVYASTRPGATRIGTLLAGEAARGSDWVVEDAEHAWMLLETPNGVGRWIPTRADGRDLVQRFRERYLGSGWVDSLASGPSGFLATAYGGTAPVSLLLSSSDGASWAVRTPGQAAYEVTSAAWGPAGWIAVTNIRNVDRSTQLHRSADGVTWELLGNLPDRFEYLCCFSVHGSEIGYLMLDGQSSVPWFSVDGVTWRQTGPLPNQRHNSVDFAATPSGFFGWLWEYDWRYEERTGVAAVFSGDGREWVPIEGGPSNDAHVAQVGDGFVGVDVDRRSGASRAWVGRFEGAGVAWEQAPGDPFGGGEITALVSDGHTAYAFGLRAVSGEPTVWVGDGRSWEAEALPASFEGQPGQAAAGPTGVTVVGARPNARGDNPIFWHLTDFGSWQAEREPVIEVVPERPRDCGEVPSDILELLTADRIDLLACFDDASITVRAMLLRCPWGCEEVDEEIEPLWLYRWDRWALAPFASPDWGSVSLAIPPSIAELPEWEGAWVEVTGHYRDPAAATCRWVGSPDRASDYDWLGDHCASHFVAESITVVDGP